MQSRCFVSVLGLSSLVGFVGLAGCGGGSSAVQPAPTTRSAYAGKWTGTPATGGFIPLPSSDTLQLTVTDDGKVTGDWVFNKQQSHYLMTGIVAENGLTDLQLQIEAKPNVAYIPEVASTHTRGAMQLFSGGTTYQSPTLSGSFAFDNGFFVTNSLTFSLTRQ